MEITPKLTFRNSAVLASIFCFVILSNAQTNIAFRHIGKENGLSQSTVFAIEQDETGFMWFATRDGLNRYNGYHFDVYRHEEEDSSSIIANDVRTLFYDRQEKVLWAGTFLGLSKYKAAKDMFVNYTHDADDPGSISHNDIKSILRDSKGNLWVGTFHGLNWYDEENDRFVRIFHAPSDNQSLSCNEVVTIYEDSNADLWVGTVNGLNRLVGHKPGKFEWERVGAENSRHWQLANQHVKALIEDRTGNLWIGTDQGGLHCWNRESDRIILYQSGNRPPYAISNNNIRSLALDQEGHLWAGTFIGLNKFISPEEGFQAYVNDVANPRSLNHNSVRAVFFDRKGSLWVGSYYGGISFLDKNNWRFTNYRRLAKRNSLTHNVISSFVEDEQGNFWIGTEGGGLSYFNQQTGLFSSFRHKPGVKNCLSGNNVKTILKDGDKLWIGTYSKGLNLFDPATASFKHYRHSEGEETGLSHDNVYSLLREGNQLWIATFGGGLNILDLEKEQFYIHRMDHSENDRISSDYVRTIFKDAAGNKWVGTEQGLNLVQENSGSNILSFKHFLPDASIYCMHEDQQRRLWIGTFNKGLYLLDASREEFTHYSVEEGLPSMAIFGILEDQKEQLWLSTNNGISKFDKVKNTFTNYDYSDGLENLEFNFNAYYRTTTGKMLFGGTNGFTMFDPASIQENQYIPPVVFTDLQVFNRKVEVEGPNTLLPQALNATKTLCFKHNQAIFSIGFSALDYFSPDNNRYRFKLEGLENDWNYTTGESRATYTIQSPGTYIFRLKGANNDGRWNPVERQLKIIVFPPPWQTWWAYVLYAMIIGGLILALYRYMGLRHRLQIQNLAQQQQEELHQMKLRFFTNITHEFRTPLTLILGPLTDMLQKQEGSAIMQRQLLSIQQNAYRLLDLVNQLLTFRRLETQHEKLETAEGNIVRFLQEIFISFQEHARIRKISYVFKAAQPEILAFYDRDKMEKVFFNLLSNAFKFTPDGGAILLEVVLQDTFLFVRIKDSGKGIPAELQGKIFERFFESGNALQMELKGSGIGLAISKMITEMHGGSISVQSELGRGAEFIVRLPLGRAHLKKDQVIPDFKNSEHSLHYSGEYTVDIPPQPPITPEQTARAAPQPLTKSSPLLLIVEDNPNVCRYIHSIFQHEYRIIEAANGLEGLAKAEEYLPNLIISDVMMPELDGASMCSQLKSRIATSHIPIILLTARTSLIFKIEGLETGADDYVIKPFDPRELRLRVRNLLHTRERLRRKFTRVYNLEPKEIALTSVDEQFLESAIQIIENNIDNVNFNIEQLAYDLAISRALLFTKFKELVNQTPNNFVKMIRLKRAAHLLLQQKCSVAEVAYQVGFRDPRYFSKCFQKQFDLTPSQFIETNPSLTTDTKPIRNN